MLEHGCLLVETGENRERSGSGEEREGSGSGNGEASEGRVVLLLSHCDKEVCPKTRFVCPKPSFICPKTAFLNGWSKPMSYIASLILARWSKPYTLKPMSYVASLILAS